MKLKKVLIMGVLVLVLSIAASIVAVERIANRQIEDLMQGSIQPLDLNDLADGTYRGEVKTIPIHVRVEVLIINHQIIEIIILEHRSGQGEPANAIVDDILFNQSLDVDIISGATYSSQAIMIAIQRALSGGAHD